MHLLIRDAQFVHLFLDLWIAAKFVNHLKTISSGIHSRIQQFNTAFIH